MPGDGADPHDRTSASPAAQSARDTLNRLFTRV